MYTILKLKRLKMTAAILTAYLSMMIFVGCGDDPDMNPFGECGGPYKVNAVDLSLFYEPYKNNQYASESDTVNLDEFNIYLKIEAEAISEISSRTASFPGVAYALSCAPNFDFQNIQGITMILLEPFGDKVAGTNISNLVTTHDNVKLSDLREFKGSLGQYRLNIDLQPDNKSQLKTRTILKLRNGTEKIFESTSPVLLTN